MDMSEQQKSNANFIHAYLVLLCLIMLVTCGLWGVIETSEARYAEISREMVLTGDWIHPRLLGIQHYHKPPITYWITASSMSLFGINEFAVRFPLVICFAVQLLLVFRIGKALFKDELTPLYAAVVYSSLPIVLVSARALTTDVFLMTWVLLGLYFWILFVTRKHAGYLYAFALICALAFLTKGPIGFIVMGPVIIAFFFLLPRPALSIMRIGIALIIFVPIAFSWFFILNREDGRFADYFFFHHLLDRFNHAETFSRRQPWYYYLPIVPLISLPWMVLVIVSFIRRQREYLDKRAVRIIIISWIVIPFIVYSAASSKLVLYILPIFGGFSLMAGNLLAQATARRIRLTVTVPIVVVFVALCLVPIFVRELDPNFLLLIIPPLILAILIIVLVKANPEHLIAVSSACLSIGLMCYATVLFRTNSGMVNSLSAVAAEIRSKGLTDRRILVYNELLPSLAFELNAPIITIYKDKQSAQREVQFERDASWQKFYIDLNQTNGRSKLNEIMSDDHVIVFKKEIPATMKELLGAYEIVQSGPWFVCWNRKVK
jgi:4-amino-4-deoxy-L-arabinose transferase-like glycosyltransferase